MKNFTTSDKVKFIQKAFGRGRMASNGKNFDIYCPICAPRDKSKKKLAIRMEDDANHCWSCSWRARTLLPLLKKYASQDLVKEYIETFLPASDAEKRRKCLFITVEGVKREFKLPHDFKLCAIQEGLNPDHLAATRYAVERRGMSERDMWYFKIGTSNEMKWHRRVLMPSFDKDGNLNYMVGRAIDKKAWKKYDQPEIDNKLHVIFNEINIDWNKQLVLCEGPFDLHKCGDNAVPLLGSSINEQSLLFERILVNKTPIALALDADMLETKVPWIARKFQEYDVDVKIVDVSKFGKSDPGEMSKDEFAHALAEARSLDWLQFMMNKLDIASRVKLSL